MSQNPPSYSNSIASDWRRSMLPSYDQFLENEWQAFCKTPIPPPTPPIRNPEFEKILLEYKESLEKVDPWQVTLPK